MNTFILILTLIALPVLFVRAGRLWREIAEFDRKDAEREARWAAFFAEENNPANYTENDHV